MTASSVRIDPITLDFDLPEDLIAQHPTEKRDDARLMVITRPKGEIQHKKFSDLSAYLKKGDVLVLNKAKVNKAQLIGKKPTGGKVTLILISQEAETPIWKALIRPQLKDGTKIEFEPGVSAYVLGQYADGEYRIEIKGMDADDLMQKKGAMPLPPYIKRSFADSLDEKDYQTVYASVPGSVAAPTAGLHFTPEQLRKIKHDGIEVLEVLLHVGWGTFKPIAQSVDAHQMLPESYEVSAEVIAALKKAKQEGRRIVGVGTTVTRTLESLPRDVSEQTQTGESRLFIKPGFKFQWIDALITNFHVPRSTPVSLTSAFLGLPQLEKAYDEAIREKYRFFSYGDAMFIQ